MKKSLFAKSQMTYTDLEHEKMTMSGSPGHKKLFPSARIGEHSLDVHPSGFALLFMICSISTQVSISIIGRSNQITSMELASRNDADGRCIARDFLTWTLWINVICKRPNKEVYQLKKINDAKKKKMMIVTAQLHSAD